MLVRRSPQIWIAVRRLIYLPIYRIGRDLWPKRGDKPEWRHTQDYWAEKDEIAAIDLDDPVFAYG